ncbi:MAG: DUF1287 domain-containing protein [Desulfobacteraceae bacterium]
MRNVAVVLYAVLLLSSGSFAEPTYDDLVVAAKERTRHDVTYDGSYFRIGYPNGDIPKNKGVCTDVIIRAYRRIGIDLQVEVHRDMQAHFQQYPKIWGLSKPDPNIDHRRVPNLQVFFQRKGLVLTASHRAEDYRPGDLVTWMLPGNLPHIGMVVDRKSEDAKRCLIVHNIGRGPRMEDALFDFPITGHYRYLPRQDHRSQDRAGG